MGIFESRDDRRERKEREARARLALYGLDELSDPRDEQLALDIVSGPVGAHAMDAAIAIGADDTNDILRRQLNYQDAIYKQNFLIIRQLDRIEKLLAAQAAGESEA